MLLELLWNEIVLRNLHLLLGQVTGDVDELHSVKKGRLDGGDVVRGSDEEHIGQIVVDVQIVVVEGIVLLRIENLEQGRGRIALVAVADLVDLIQDDDRIGCAGLVDAIQDSSRKRSDVGLPVAPEFSFIVHATQSPSDIFPAQGPCHGLSETGLADSRRAVQAEDR